MNLVERLGGYEAAKAEGEKWGFDDFLNNQLLEYRRANNIFEVGDRVVFIESELKNPRLMTVIEVCEPVCGFLMAECGWGITNGFYPSRYRHATDAEIKAGKRLEVK